MNTQCSKAKGNDFIDLVKFILSILIVAMHTQLFCGVIYPVTRLAVPIFFTLSSYFFFSKQMALPESEKNKHFSLFAKRNLTLYLFWFIALLPLTIYIGKYYEGNILASLLKMLKNFFFASTFQVSWYLMALIIGTGIVFLLSKKLSNTSLFIVGILFYCVACLSSNYIFIVLKNDNLLEIYKSVKSVVDLPCRNFIVSVIYIVLGKIIAQTKAHKIGTKKSIIFATVSFALLIAECIIIEKSDVKVYDNDCFIFLVPTAFFIVTACVNSAISLPHAKILRNISTVVYCIHMPVFMVIGKLMSILEVQDKYNLIVFSITSLLSCLAGIVILSLEKRKGLTFLKYSH